MRAPQWVKCDGKVRFRSMKQARRVKRRMRKGGGGGGGEHVQPYHCPYCHGFHLGVALGGQKAIKRPRYEPTDEEVFA